MKKYFIIVFIALGMLLSHCKKDKEGSALNPQNESSIIVDAMLYENAPRDEFLFDHVEITDDSMRISIQYGGGCGNIEVKLIDSETLMESLPVQRFIRLSLRDEDPCEALITEDFTFDLSPVQDTSYDKIILHLDGWEPELVYEY